MQAKITGKDGKGRCVRSLRCALAAAMKKIPKYLRAQHGDVLRQMRSLNLKAKNAPARYARRAALHASA